MFKHYYSCEGKRSPAGTKACPFQPNSDSENHSLE